MKEKQVHKGRIILLISLIVIVFVAFALKLMQYQIVNAEEYKEMAQGNYTSVQSIDAARGEILDRYGIRKKEFPPVKYITSASSKTDCIVE